MLSDGIRAEVALVTFKMLSSAVLQLMLDVGDEAPKLRCSKVSFNFACRISWERNGSFGYLFGVLCAFVSRRNAW